MRRSSFFPRRPASARTSFFRSSISAGKRAAVASPPRSSTIGSRMKSACSAAPRQTPAPCDFHLRDVVNTHGAGVWRGAALQVDFILEPIVEDRGGDATAARFPALIDERKKLVRALAGLRGKKDDRRIAQEFQFGADHFFVVKHQAARIEVFRFVAFAGSALGFAFRRGGIA